MVKKHLNESNLNALVNEVLAIESQASQDAGAVGFMARALVQTVGRARLFAPDSLRSGLIVGQ